MFAEFCPISSGSNGNCIYAATEHSNILIDAGMSGVKIERGLQAIGVHPSEIDAIFITHEHSDHIMGAGVFSRRYGVPLFASMGTWEYIDRNVSLGKLAPEKKHAVFTDEDLCFRDLIVRPFDISHDAAEPVGYSFFTEKHKITVATDIGQVDNTLKENLRDSDILLFEANHDVDMLKNGSYPYVLKKRIMSEKGHLSNVHCGQTINEIATERLKHVYLGHLSEENNEPKLAYETVSGILESGGNPSARGIKLYMADRYKVSRFIRVD